MAGKKIDPMSEAAMEVVNMDRQREEQAKQAQADREAMIGQCYKAIGQVQTSNMFAKFATVSSLVWLKQVKASKVYKDIPGVGTWDKFCDYTGMSRAKVDEDLVNLAVFGEEFLLTCQQLSVGYRDLRKLRQLTHDGAVTIDAEYMVIGEERIPIDADHKEDLQAAIETIIEQQAALKAEVEAQKKSYTRVQDGNHKEIVKLQKELDSLNNKAQAKGLTPEEDAFIQKCDHARLTIDGFLNQFDPSINPLPDDATPRMRATLMHTLAWFKRCIIISVDTANDLYGEPELDDEWIPPHLRKKEEAAPEFPLGRGCSGCGYHKGMINSAHGVKIPGLSGKCTRPEGLCDPSQSSQGKEEE